EEVQRLASEAARSGQHGRSLGDWLSLFLADQESKTGSRPERRPIRGQAIRRRSGAELRILRRQGARPEDLPLCERQLPIAGHDGSNGRGRVGSALGAMAGWVWR